MIDLLPGRGALGGLFTALFYTSHPLVLLAPCDTPFLQPSLLQYMIVRCSQPGVEAVVCQSYKGLEPLPGVFSAKLQSRLQEHLATQDYRMRSFLAKCRTSVLAQEEVTRYDPEGKSFFNINTAADLLQAEQIVISN
jgi:molybdopterin-guanine dinucleotide biosynthesis protein A